MRAIKCRVMIKAKAPIKLVSSTSSGSKDLKKWAHITKFSYAKLCPCHMCVRAISAYKQGFLARSDFNQL